MTQRPELFGATVPQVGVMDMLRYHEFTGGAAWATEYGAATDSAAFAW
jgi:prolyl oligopeptidase